MASCVEQQLEFQNDNTLVNIGWLYDANTDEIVKKSTILDEYIRESILPRHIQCRYLTGEEFKNQSLFEKIGLSPESQIKALLESTSNSSIPSIINRSIEITQNTRFFYFNHVQKERSISESIDKLKRIIISNQVESATHFVSSLRIGLQLLVIIEVMGDVQQVDNFMEEFCRKTSNSDTTMLRDFPDNYSDRINIKSTFSNENTIIQTKNFKNISSEMKKSVECSIGCNSSSFILKPLTSLDQSDLSQSNEYHRLGHEHLQLLHQYVIPLVIKFNELKSSNFSIEKHKKDLIDQIRPLIIESRSENMRIEEFRRQIVEDIHPQFMKIFNNIPESKLSLSEHPPQDNHQGEIDRKKQPSPFTEKKPTRPISPRKLEHSDSFETTSRQPISTSPKIETEQRHIKSTTITTSRENNDAKHSHRQTGDEQQSSRSQSSKRIDASLKDKVMEPILSSKLVSSLPLSDNSPTSFPSKVRKNEIITENTSRTHNPNTLGSSIREEPQRDKITEVNGTTDFNVLLLGESGVGKSTFINAFVNYSKFQSLDQAKKKMIVVLPVSFILTHGHDFDEHLISFGQKDSNEAHRHPGQTVTQQCRSYLFQLSEKINLRLIDTPGIGDTRGIEQDERNLDHIISFISSLSHINAICILLKPNESRSNIVLRLYFNRLMRFLGEKASSNIMFCFTNTRSTNYSVGDSGPMIPKVIAETEMKSVPFQKKNVFCFDSESFRYLVAVENGFTFERIDVQEYQMSWTKSRQECKRLLECIFTGIRPLIQNEWRSTEHLEYLIKLMADPLVEAVQHILRNLTMQHLSPSKFHIELGTEFLKEKSFVCLKCPRQLQKYLDIWIFVDEPQPMVDRCRRCSCKNEYHLEVRYRRIYKVIEVAETNHVEKLQKDLQQLKRILAKICETCVDLHIDNSIMRSLKRAMNDEKIIIREKGEDCLNFNVGYKLNEIIKNVGSIKEEGRTIDINEVYKILKELQEIEIVKSQWNTTLKTLNESMKLNEKKIDQLNI